jgi:hypothetical protein
MAVGRDKRAAAQFRAAKGPTARTGLFGIHADPSAPVVASSARAIKASFMIFLLNGRDIHPDGANGKFKLGHYRVADLDCVFGSRLAARGSFRGSVISSASLLSHCEIAPGYNDEV